MTHIQPIQTQYKGYLFRSRLEARWAVFFDYIGLEWTYEPEGFEFDSGLRYLPDFYFPQWRLWAEIKPSSHPAGDWGNCETFRNKTNYPILFLRGTPGDSWFTSRITPLYMLFCYDCCDSGGGASEWMVSFDATGIRCPVLFCGDPGAGTNHTLLNGEWESLSFISYNYPENHKKLIVPAYQAARSARFEFGARP